MGLLFYGSPRGLAAPQASFGHDVYLKSSAIARVDFEAKVYADNFAEPPVLSAAWGSVTSRPTKLLELLPYLASIREQARTGYSTAWYR